MKSLVLKDIFNILHNLKSLLFVLLILSITLIPQSNIILYPIFCTLTCTSMIITTFYFDETCKWNRTALTFPISRKSVVTSKYCIMTIFCLFGCIFSILIECIYHLFFPSFDIYTALFSCLIAIPAALLTGFIIIPILFRFSAEKARLFTVLALLIPSFIIGAWLNINKNIPIQDTISHLSIAMFILLVPCFFISHFASIHILNKKDL